MAGRAADIVVQGVEPEIVHDTALRLVKEGPVKITGLGKYPRFTNVDVRPGGRLARWAGSRTGS